MGPQKISTKNLTSSTTVKEKADRIPT